MIGRGDDVKALQKTAPSFGVELREVADPGAPGPGEVLLDVAAAGICGSDLHIYEWSGGYEFVTAAMPVTLGHEFAGRVVAVGAGVAALAVGDRVTVMPSITCGTCWACRGRDFDRCLTRTGIGMTRPGAFARRVLAPAINCLRLPDAIDDELAALTEPLTVGARAVESGEVTNGQRVLVMGPGTVGQTIAVMARAAGAEVTVVGKDDPDRLACLRALGFTRTLDLRDGPLGDQAGPDKFDVVFEATGVPATLDHGLEVLRRWGILVVCGIHAAPAAIDVNRLVREQQQIRGSSRATRATWTRVLEVLAREGERLRPMITHRLPLERVVEGFELARHKIASKVMILPNS
jgi:2-desacetyl-2-hydroxyethyl bacteriochlorophyllide A dehydrogenase